MKRFGLIFGILIIVATVIVVGIAKQASAATPHATTSQTPRVFLLDPAILQHTKQAAASDPVLKSSLQQLTQQAKALLTANPVSVMDKTQTLPGVSKHEYLSLATYYWPNPKTSNGLPYIEHDGLVNPEVATYGDLTAITTMISRVDTLAYAYYFTGNISYATQAGKFLRVWFLNSATKMNPDMTHAQLVKGADTGRREGIIDAKDFSHLVDDIGLLQPSPSWAKSDQQGMQSWFGKYLTWLRTSPFGKMEAAASNNHSTWYDEQTASIAFFVNQTSVAQGILRGSVAKHIDGHINSDGNQPLEIVRPNSWHYCVWNLTALFRLARLGDQVSGVHLWTYKNSQGAGLLTALGFVEPAALNPKVWTHQQIIPLDPTELVDVLYQAATHYQQSSYRQAAQAILGSNANMSIDNLLYGDGK
jgi:hypothetical protein